MEDKNDGKRKSPIDQYANVDLPPVAMGPGAIPQAGPIGVSPAVPAATPETFVCLRGPCRHYWELQTFMASGNPKETWDPVIGLKDADGKPIRMPRQINRTCLAHPGTETELTEDAVYVCTKWEPITPREQKRLDKVRRVYLKIHPEHDPRQR